MSLRRPALLAWVAASCLGTLTVPAPAHAADGVILDPGSPAGVEYAIPLESTRRDFGGGGTNTPNQTGATAPASAPSGTQRAAALFGTGVTPASPAPRGARTTRPSRSDGTGVPTVKAASTVSDTTLTGGIVVAVLGVALALAAAIRLRRRTEG